MTDALDAAAVDRAAAELFEASRTRRPLEPLTERWPELTAREGYRIQREVVRRRLEAGETLIGWKLGLTSEAMQRQLGVDQPDYGPLLTGHVVADGGSVSIGMLIAPRVEAEIAIRLGHKLRGPGISLEAASAAVQAVAPALEIIDSRIVDWRIHLADTIADLASSARIVVAPQFTSAAGLDLGAVGVVLARNDEEVARGQGAAVLGNPIAALAWAANTLGELGVTLESGQIIMPGAMHASVPARQDDTFVATFDPLGSVSVSFMA